MKDNGGSGSALNAPLGLALAPNGDILTVNGGAATSSRRSPAALRWAPIPSRAPEAVPHERGIYFVNDADNTLKRFH